MYKSKTKTIVTTQNAVEGHIVTVIEKNEQIRQKSKVGNLHDM